MAIVPIWGIVTMWLYLQVKKRMPASIRSTIEATEHTIRLDDGIIPDTTALYGRSIWFDNMKYEFDRFGLTGEPVFVRSDISMGE
jgi:hypothetical protein